MKKDGAVCTTFYQHIAEVQLNFGCSHNHKVMPGFAARPYTSRLSGWCSTIRCIYLVQGYQADERGGDSKGAGKGIRQRTLPLYSAAYQK